MSIRIRLESNHHLIIYKYHIATIYTSHRSGSYLGSYIFSQTKVGTSSGDVEMEFVMRYPILVRAITSSLAQIEYRRVRKLNVSNGYCY
jgi:hypothetical protein